jgi:peptidoglycan/LPS O-acetylase OafA/YrhL
MLQDKLRNNFDLIRLCLAAAVVLAHLVSSLPADYGPIATWVRLFSGTNAVDCFFVISGFLIFRSYRRSRSLIDYAERRARRIYPGLVAVVLICALGGYALSTFPAAAYFGKSVLRYVVFNLTFMTFKQRTLPGVFENMPQNYINGPLWTLKIEVLFYATVPILVVLSRRLVRFPILACIIYVLSVVYHFALTRWGNEAHSTAIIELSRQLPGQMSFFIAGGLIEYVLPTFARAARWLVPAAAICLGLCAVFGNDSWAYPLYPGALAAVVLAICTVLPPIAQAARYGDFSYGLYIVHYPILQTFGTLHVLDRYPFARACAALSCCLLGAVLSWHLVEKRWLRPSPPRLLAAASAT